MTIFITNPFPGIGEAVKSYGAQFFHNLSAAVKIAANETLREWIKKVKESHSKEGWKRKYIDSIRIEPGPGDLEATVGAGGMYARLVENGRKRWSIKEALLKNAKHRDENGQPYAIVFMRKGTPDAQHIKPMPEEVHRMVSKIDFNSSLRKIGTFGMTEEEIKKGKERGWKSGLYEGLTRVGRKHHEQYGTFRVVTKKSQGWIYPTVPKSPVFEQTMSRMAPRIKTIMQKGVVKDLEEGLSHLDEIMRRNAEKGKKA